MPILTPPPFIQGGSHSAKNVRQFVSAMTGQPVEKFVNSVGAVGPAHGLVSTGDLAVVQNGTPNMSVNVGIGRAFISGNSSLVQGAYIFTNDATTNVVIAAADASNARRDLVCAQVRETVEDASGANDARLFVVTGTPAATPVDPAIPAGCLVLARVTVAALSTSVTNANIATVALVATGSGSHVAVSTFGAWTSWTPVVTQGVNVTVTNHVSRFARYGRTIHFHSFLVVTGSGTAANPVSISLPVTAESTASGGGMGFVFDNSVSFFYPGLIQFPTITTMSLIATNATVGGGDPFLGTQVFTAALAVGDQVRLHGTFEAAA